MGFADFKDILGPSKPVTATAKDGKKYKIDTFVPARASLVILQHYEKIVELLKTKKPDDETYDILLLIVGEVTKRQYSFMTAEWIDSNLSVFDFTRIATAIVLQAVDFLSQTTPETVGEREEAQPLSASE